MKDRGTVFTSKKGKKATQNQAQHFTGLERTGGRFRCLACSTATDLDGNVMSIATGAIPRTSPPSRNSAKGYGLDA